MGECFHCSCTNTDALYSILQLGTTTHSFENGRHVPTTPSPTGLSAQPAPELSAAIAMIAQEAARAVEARAAQAQAEAQAQAVQAGKAAQAQAEVREDLIRDEAMAIFNVEVRCACFHLLLPISPQV
jgi:hypothetical protein